MQIAYYDESGDDGFPRYSSQFFVLSAVYVHYLNWKDCLEAIRDFRRGLKESFGLPVRMEMHTKHFLLNKNPYRELGIEDSHRKHIVGLFCDLIGNLDVRIINVVIVKPRIRKPDYDVLDTALTYSIQRVENDLNPAANPEAKSMIITDPGRVGKMRKTSRRIQRINFIPSKFSPSRYRREIQSLIEDPLPKDSKESYFIQMADVVSFVIYLYSVTVTGIGAYPRRLRALVRPKEVEGWMDRLKPSLNLQASRSDPYGVVFHPKN